MAGGVIIKALSGFYYVQTEQGIVACRARGRFRADGTSPLVGDRVNVLTEADGKGRVESVEPRRNWFVRPAVANVDAIVFAAANTNPVTDPFLIDRVSVIAGAAGCELIVCINKTDLDPARELYEIYSKAGFTVIRTSAQTGEGIGELRRALQGKVSAFTGNSGVGKSSLINCLLPEAGIPTGQVSERLGRGKHTTRHVELYALDKESFVADTPGFASFDIEMMEPIAKEELQNLFIEFEPYIGACRFADCAHLREPDCAVTRAVAAGEISPVRYKSYERLYDLTARRLPWEIKEK